MKISKKGIVINKTLQFLIPILRVYGKEFMFYLDHLNRVAFGIKDSVKSYEENIIHILFNTEKTINLFGEYLIWIKKQSFYIDDYLFGNSTNSSYHMIVIKFPDEYFVAYKEFNKGRYSKMYNSIDIEKYFPYKITKAILYKSKNMGYLILKEIEKEFGEKNIITLKEIMENENKWEWCLPPLSKNEFFNK